MNWRRYSSVLVARRRHRRCLGAPCAAALRPPALLALALLAAGCSANLLYEGRLPGECSDAADNDIDGLFDCNDPGCAGAPACTTPTLSDLFTLGPQLECVDPVTGMDRLTELGEERGLTTMVGTPGAGAQGQTAQGGALAIEDLDGDGDFDIVQSPKTLYINDGSGHFTFKNGPIISSSNKPTGYVALADLDGDGLPEMIGDWNETMPIQPRLWRNLGDMEFELVQILDVPNNSYELSNPTVTLGDIDGDGDLDLAYITGGLDNSTGGGYPTTLYRYQAEQGVFEHLVDLKYDGARGISSQVAFFVDHDSDGDADLYVPNDWSEIGLPSALWRNDGVDDGGAPILVEYGSSVFADLDMIAMGIDSIDLNFDGRLDYCITDVGPPRCIQSQDDGSYVEVGSAMGLYPAAGFGAAILTVGWSLDFADLDNDGWVEVIQPAAPDSATTEMGFTEFPDLLWQGLGPGQFLDASEISGFDSVDNHFGMATADLDGDGFLDIVTAGPGTTPALYMNQCGAGAWIEVELVGPAENTQGFGAQVQVDDGTRVHLREMHGLRATGQGPSRLHFGLGDLDVVTRVTIRWPDGEIAEAQDIGSRRVITVAHSNAVERP